MRVVFMGTPDFAVPCLVALLQADYEVLAVVTQPDRPKGRGQQIVYSPVKQAALGAGLKILQPQKVREKGFLAELRELDPEVIVVVAFGQILPPGILDLPPFGCVNVHASLLPKYRGAAPIHRCIIEGEEKTGVTTMRMERGLDTGDMLLQAETTIDPEDTVGTLHDRLARLGGDLLVETLTGLANGSLKGTPQNHSESTYAALLAREDELIPWEKDNNQVVNLIRGMNPWPGAYTTCQGRIIKIWRAELAAGGGTAGPGTVVQVDKNQGFTVQTGRGQVLVKEVQPQGGKRMEAAAFARGYNISPGQVLGSSV